MEFDEELFPLEAELPDLGPGEGVDLSEVLEDEYAHARHRQVQAHTLVVLQHTQREGYSGHQCSGSGSIGSTCFWASRVRIQIHMSEVWIRILLIIMQK